MIAKAIYRRFKGDRLELLVKAILETKGYSVHDPGSGPDNGIDLLAGQGALGFAEPLICVQVKCLDGPIERTVLDQLLGTMTKVGATHGLLVSWGGFKASYDREKANQFFKVRLWDQDDVIDELLACYESLDVEIKTDLPLKRVWTVAEDD